MKTKIKLTKIEEIGLGFHMKVSKQSGKTYLSKILMKRIAGA